MKSARLLYVASSIFSVLCLSAPAARAGTHTWSGAVSGLWSVPGNWSSGGVPAVTETGIALIFPATATHRTDTDNIPGLTVDTNIIDGGGYTFNDEAEYLAPALTTPPSKKNSPPAGTAATRPPPPTPTASPTSTPAWSPP